MKARLTFSSSAILYLYYCTCRSGDMAGVREGLRRGEDISCMGGWDNRWHRKSIAEKVNELEEEKQGGSLCFVVLAFFHFDAINPGGIE